MNGVYKNHQNYAVLNECRPPDDDDLVREVMAGVDYSEPVSFEREPEWHLESIIVEDEEHAVSESGGVEMAEVVLPVTRLLEETRLRHVGEEQTPMILVHGVEGDADYVASHNPELQARRLVEMGLTEPWAAELYLEFECRSSNDSILECFEKS